MRPFSLMMATFKCTYIKKLVGTSTSDRKVGNLKSIHNFPKVLEGCTLCLIFYTGDPNPTYL
jgi:hypothetical protein